MTDLFRSGSSLLGNLLSLHPSTSFYYEPFKKFNIFKDCHHRFNNSEVSNFIEEILGGIFKCEDKVLKNIKKSRKCKKTSITVIKTIRIHLNGILPWLHKFPSLKVGTYFFFMIIIPPLKRLFTLFVTRGSRLNQGCGSLNLFFVSPGI